MTGPRELIRKAAQRREAVPDVKDERIPAPVPMQQAAPMQCGGIKMPMDISAEAVSGTDKRGKPYSERPSTGETYNRMPSEAERCACAEPVHEGRRPVCQNLGGHAIYRELMRSHDRMGTRHISPKG